ncbi:Transcription initiation factor TFIID subunit 12 [Saxophila tyrrhenica]|uniref:Transcription initiation factor TFIID subunit 12 n=1 Tax=Saxophila tyrrhenica TaxID=1690608 RepID=A0AAV9P7Q6_9PEZI|nr:Transcription initiation factor TFIID subunit 12 [Saxophila tyrrhenica]
MAQPNNQQSGHPLIKPGQVEGLPQLTTLQKEHYKAGLTKLYSVLQSNPPGSAEHKAAEAKIREASVKIMQQISGANRPNTGGAQQQPQQQQQRPQSQQGGNQGGMPQSVGMAQQGSQQGGQPGQGQQGQQPQPQMSQNVRNELQNIVVNFPPQVYGQGQQSMNAYRTQWYRKGAQILNKIEGLKAKGQGLQRQQQGGQGDQQAVQRELQNCKNELMQSRNEWEQLKNTNQKFAQGQGQGMQRQQSNQGPSQQMNGAQQQQQQQQHSMQQGDVKMQMDPGSAQSPQPLQGGFQQVQQQQAQPPQSQVAPSHQNMSQPPQSAHSQTPQSANQPQPPQQQHYPQHQNMQQQQQHPNQPQRPTLNAQHMQQAQQNMVQAQQQQQQHHNNPAMPQGGNQQQMPRQQQPQQQQPPPTLSHQAAINQAAESYSRQQAQTQQQPQQQQQQQQQQMPQVPNGLPLNQPQSATQQTPTSAYPTLQQNKTPAGGSNSLGRPLQLDPRTQQPVQGQPSRPTYANAGMLSQPGIQRPAQFTLEGEGDRVLSKRKLDELVRQVTGTVSSDDTNALAPDVEESVLTLADNFVDEVITAACRLAKLRPAQTLDVRDIQIVLERNYGIRIPGYGLDEVRTVRKFQPAAGWQQKMQAVQAGKVMGGGGNKDL